MDPKEEARQAAAAAAGAGEGQDPEGAEAQGDPGGKRLADGEVEAGAGEGAEAQAGEAQGAEAEGGEAGKGKGNVGKALHVERERRRIAEEVNRRLQERLETLSQGGTAEPLKVDVDDEDILTGKQVRELMERQRQALRQDVTGIVQAQVRATELMDYVGSFEVFNLESSLGVLGRSALSARLAEIQNVGTPEGLAEARAAVDEIARQMSEQQAAGHNAAANRGAGGARTVRQSSGAATAAHVVLPKKAPESAEETSTQAMKQVTGFARAAFKRFGIR